MILKRIGRDKLTATFRIYVVTNKINGKRYVGKESGYIGKRWHLHKAEAKRGKTTLLATAIREHGHEAFSVIYVFQTEDENQVKRKEEELIKKLGTHYKNGSGYNMTTGSQGGVQWTKEAILAIAAKFNRPIDWYRSDSASYYAARYHGWLDLAFPKGKKAKGEWTESEIRDAAKKYPTSSEWKIKDKRTYDAVAYRKMLPELTRHMRFTIHAGRPIIMDNEKLFWSQTEAAEELGASVQNISACIKGRRNTTKGHVFRLATYNEVVAQGGDPIKYKFLAKDKSR